MKCEIENRHFREIMLRWTLAGRIRNVARDGKAFAVTHALVQKRHHQSIALGSQARLCENKNGFKGHSLPCEASYQPFSSSAERRSGLSFPEEPLGVPASKGYGYAQLDFGERIGPEKRYEIVRKLGWGSYSSVWLAWDVL